MSKQILGIDDAVNACDCCGKTGLKFTFIVDFGGEIMHVGSTCVTKWTGKTVAAAVAEIFAAQSAVQQGNQQRLDATPEAVALRAKMTQAHAARLVGVPFRDFCAAERAAYELKKIEIFA